MEAEMNEERRETILGDWILEENTPTFGERLADKVADFGGSWAFIIVFLAIMAVWISLNGLSLFLFDPPPLILLNLANQLTSPMFAHKGSRGYFSLF
jgi:uncharacterized membrane protein